MSRTTKDYYITLEANKVHFESHGMFSKVYCKYAMIEVYNRNCEYNMEKMSKVQTKLDNMKCLILNISLLVSCHVQCIIVYQLCLWHRFMSVASRVQLNYTTVISNKEHFNDEIEIEPLNLNWVIQRTRIPSK